MSFWKEYAAYIKDNPEGYWFKRKLYGWGWTPATREGWAVTFIFMALIVANAFRLESTLRLEDSVPLAFLAQSAGLIFLLLLVCWKTGEPAGWMWGFPKHDR